MIQLKMIKCSCISIDTVCLDQFLVRGRDDNSEKFRYHSIRNKMICDLLAAFDNGKTLYPEIYLLFEGHPFLEYRGRYFKIYEHGSAIEEFLEYASNIENLRGFEVNGKKLYYVGRAKIPD